MPQIIGHHLCPYVQRVVILMLEKDIRFERIDIDLDNKPVWLIQHSPTAKVPLLIADNGRALFESQVICEYLDEISPGSMQPTDSFEKARLRAWGEIGTNILNIIAQLIYRDSNQSLFEKSIAKLLQQLRQIESEHSGASYFAGNQFYLIDALYATLLRYMKVVQLATAQPLLLQFPKLVTWQINLSIRPSVIAAVPLEYDRLLINFITSKPSYLAQALTNS